MINVRCSSSSFAGHGKEPALSLPQFETLEEGSMIWVDLSEPTQEELDLVLRQWFPVHDLVISDCNRAMMLHDDERPHHPKVEEFDNYVFCIIHAPPEHNPSDTYLTFIPRQVNIVVGSNVLITHHAGPLAPLMPLLDQCQIHARLMARGPDFLMHLVFDEIVDMYLPLVTRVEDELEDLEGEVLRRATQKILLRLLHIKRQIQEARRSIVYMREVTNRLARGEFDLVSMEESMYYRNVYDHLVRVADQLDAARESVLSMMEAYFSASNARLNEVMRILTVISTVFLPMTFISSVYGMNFGSMPELNWEYGYLAAWVLMISIGASMIILFRRKGWLG